MFCTFAKNMSINVAMSVCPSVGYLTTLSVSRQHIIGKRLIIERGTVGGMRIQKGN
jgi:hypothetical protein